MVAPNKTNLECMMKKIVKTKKPRIRKAEGILPGPISLMLSGYADLVTAMCERPKLFAHIEQATDRLDDVRAMALLFSEWCEVLEKCALKGKRMMARIAPTAVKYGMKGRPCTARRN